MANDYYDFNPSATTWVLMLSVVVLFTMALCVLLIAALYRIEASSSGRATAKVETDDAAATARPPVTAPERLVRPTAALP